MNRLTIAAVLLLSVSPALAGAELVFEDGQVLAGVEVTRRGNEYLLELETGQVIAIPAALVKEVRLTGDDKYSREGLRWTDGERVSDAEVDPGAPSGLRQAEPETIVGRPEAAMAPKRAEQVRVFGEPSRFRDDFVDDSWDPSTDWDFDTERQNNFDPSSWTEGPIDPIWTPRSGYDAGRDVLAGNRSDWHQGAIDPEWVPQDGFDRRNQAFDVTSGRARPPEPDTGATARGATYAGAVPPSRFSRGESRAPRRATYARALTRSTRGFGVFTVERIVEASAPPPPKPPPLTPEVCARNLHPALGATVRVVVVEALDVLPVKLHEATGVQEGSTLRAVFAIVGDECRLIAGTLSRLLGVEMTPDHAAAYASSAFNTLLDAAGGVVLASDEQKVAYARAVASLIDPLGADRLLLRRDDLDEVLAGRAADCELGRRLLRRQVKSAKREFHKADRETGGGSDVFVFYTWSRRGGELARYSVLIAADGQVALQRARIAAHLGDHLCGR